MTAVGWLVLPAPVGFLGDSEVALQPGHPLGQPGDFGSQVLNLGGHLGETVFYLTESKIDVVETLDHVVKPAVHIVEPAVHVVKPAIHLVPKKQERRHVERRKTDADADYRVNFRAQRRTILGSCCGYDNTALLSRPVSVPGR